MTEKTPKCFLVIAFWEQADLHDPDEAVAFGDEYAAISYANDRIQELRDSSTMRESERGEIIVERTPSSSGIIYSIGDLITTMEVWPISMFGLTRKEA